MMQANEIIIHIYDDALAKLWYYVERQEKKNQDLLGIEPQDNS